ncbi:hypothetical protein NEOLEDRAFT_1157537 [Neolentinus lepideus HHB14362 ss-1]|uniref:Uncharacterized protein n=1 Tax=Neolentinus lepideus HHB14362 ss-1 TaxID=1314782 RepID=A0A165QVU7_9AGAM|nr:hypothetical protein NEOLEDRAFT_1157537 [Neolentinus lepideus HHB14362 ss-1]
MSFEPNSVEDAVRMFLSYPFAEDQTYQQGLASILSSGSLEGKSEEEQENLLRRSQIYYFNRIAQTSITLDDVLALQGSLSSASADTIQLTNGTEHFNFTTVFAPEETHTLSFAELKELIEQGKTDQIPNNKTIPDALNTASPSESKSQPRKKPWE